MTGGHIQAESRGQALRQVGGGPVVRRQAEAEIRPHVALCSKFKLIRGFLICCEKLGSRKAIMAGHKHEIRQVSLVITPRFSSLEV